MALSKTLTRRSRISGNYIALRYFWVDDLKRTARGYFALYESRAAAVEDPDSPMVPIVCKVELRDDNFESRLGGANRNKNPRAVLYQALRDGVGVIADEGQAFYSDAEDV